MMKEVDAYRSVISLPAAVGDCDGVGRCNIAGQQTGLLARVRDWKEAETEERTAGSGDVLWSCGEAKGRGWQTTRRTRICPHVGCRDPWVLGRIRMWGLAGLHREVPLSTPTGFRRIPSAAVPERLQLGARCHGAALQGPPPILMVAGKLPKR
jgi:hypothetical protein